MPKSVIHLCIIHPLVLCKIDFFQNTSEAHPKLKETKVHKKLFLVILLSCFFLSKANLPPGDIYQCLKRFLIVTTRGMLRSLMSSSQARCLTSCKRTAQSPQQRLLCPNSDRALTRSPARKSNTETCAGAGECSL